MKAILFITVALLGLAACNETSPTTEHPNLQYFRDGQYCFAKYNSVTYGGYQTSSISNVSCAFMPAEKVGK